MKEVAGNITAARLNFSSSSLRSGGSSLAGSQFEALAREHSLFAALSRTAGSVSIWATPDGGQFSSSLLLVVGCGIVVLVCVMLLLNKSDQQFKKQRRRSDDDSSESSTAQSVASSGPPSPVSKHDRGPAKVKARSQLFLKSSGRSTKRAESSSSSSESDLETATTRTGTEEQGGFFAEKIYEVDREQLEMDMGVSGMCLASQLEDMRTVVLIAMQAFFLQAMILFYIAGTLQPNPDLNAKKSLPLILVQAAIYLHFVSCVRDLPQSILLLRRFPSYHKTDIETIVFGGIFLVDAIIVPLSQLFVGAMFLCTSMTVADIIMNSCAVSYISSIDDWILEVHRSLNSLALNEKDYSQYEKIQLRVPTKLINIINWTGCVVPVFPGIFSCMVAHYGLEVLKL